MTAASPWRKSTLTPAWLAFSVPIWTKVRLMSRPVTWNPSRAISTARYPRAGRHLEHFRARREALCQLSGLLPVFLNLIA